MAATADLVFDIGAHTGEDTRFYLDAGYRVVAVEALPTLAEQLRRDFAEQIAQGRCTVVEKAIAEGKGEVAFYATEYTGWGTIRKEHADRAALMHSPSRRIMVPSTTAEALFRKFGVPHYLKVDIEGADELCLQGLFAVAHRPDFVSLETDPMVSFDGPERVISLLERLGYRRFQIVRQGNHLPMEIVDRSGRRRTVTFAEGGSGPFGPYLTGAWLTAQQARRRFRWIALLNRVLGRKSRLGAIARRIPLVRRYAIGIGWYDTHAAR